MTTDLARLHLLLTYLLICVGTTAMWIGEPEAVHPYPLVVITCAIAAYHFTDQRRIVRLSVWVSNSLALLILAAIILEIRDRSAMVLLALAHFLVYLQIAKCFREKKPSDFWQIYVINALQVAIACVLNHSLLFGLMLLSYVLLAMLTLTVFQLRRHADQMAESAFVFHGEQERRPNHAAPMPWIRITGPIKPLLGQSLLGWLACLVLAVPVFWIIPRSGRLDPREERFGTTVVPTRQVTGFSESVRLDELSSVMESEEIVMNIWCRDANGEKTPLPAELRWRGAVFTSYRDQSWRATPPAYAHEFVRFRGEPAPLSQGQYELEIEQSRTAGNVLFAPRPVYWAGFDRSDFVANLERVESRLFSRGGLQFAKRGPTTLRYRVHVAFDESGVADEVPPSDTYLEMTKHLPRHLTNLRELALELTEGVPADDIKGKIRRVMDHLTDANIFDYTLDLGRTNTTVDPVEDFLFYRQEGHCEYFATSAALLLRAVGVSTRLVNGFKGADYNDTGRFYQVPQLLAHSWAEAYDPAQQRWLTLDPTPSVGRDLAVAGQRSWFGPIKRVFGVATRLWDRYILEYSEQDQTGALSRIEPRQIQRVLDSGMRALRESMPTLDGAGSFDVSVGARVLIASALVLLALVTGFRGRRWLKLGFRLWKRPTRNRALADPLYERWKAMCAGRGLVRRPTQTPLEFAFEIQHLLEKNDETRPWASLPVELARRHYQVRFGAEPPPADVEDLRGELDRFASATHRVSWQ
ncbi:MAG: DUF3488 and transglutaminase-like domain-containing protein [Planctomycetota bacterium]